METIKYQLTKDSRVIFEGTENECFFRLQSVQSQSADWAIKFEGYKVELIDVVKIEYTRKDVINNVCTHREYYAQFVTDELKSTILNIVGIERLLKSTDAHLNDIPIIMWDSISAPFGTSAKMKSRGDSLTLSGQVCIAKEAAKQIIESNN
jgi:hypothetical protein